MRRRTFLQSATACAVSGLAGSTARADRGRTDVSGVSGYGYRLPKIQAGWAEWRGRVDQLRPIVSRLAMQFEAAAKTWGPRPGAAAP